MEIFHWVADTLRQYPELAIFLTIALGFWIGRWQFKSFSLGAVTGTLLVGILVGQLGIEISSQIKSIFFIMFLFSVGFGIGPQFVRGVASDGLPQAIFAAVICCLCLGCIYIASTVAGYGPGLTAGLLAGSQTISASIGLATNAINQLPLSADAIEYELSQIPVAYAVTYIFGTIGTGWILAFLGPKILRINLKEECARYEKEMSKDAPTEGIQSAWHQYIIRAYQLEDQKIADQTIVGKTVKQAEALTPERIFVERIRRNGKIIDFDENTVLELNDIVAVSGKHEILVHWSNMATDVADKEIIDIPVEVVDMIITNKSINQKTLLELSKTPQAKGVFIKRIRRGSMGVDIPIFAQTKLYRGDILTISGTRKHIDNAVQEYGFADRPTSVTDMVFVGFGIFIGGLFGAVVIHVHGVPLTLSTAGGALISGLFFGWLRSFQPKLGSVPSATLWFMNSVGLNIFIAVVGITAGPTFVQGVQEVGLEMFFWGIFVTGTPMLLSPLIGKYIFKFDPAINLGCCGGARTSTASVAMVADVAKSNVPMLGYTVPYAVSNTLLTLWGMVVILLIR